MGGSTGYYITASTSRELKPSSSSTSYTPEKLKNLKIRMKTVEKRVIIGNYNRY